MSLLACIDADLHDQILAGYERIRIEKDFIIISKINEIEIYYTFQFLILSPDLRSQMS